MAKIDDAHPQGLAVWKVPKGYKASIETAHGVWTDDVFAKTVSAVIDAAADRLAYENAPTAAEAEPDPFAITDEMDFG